MSKKLFLMMSISSVLFSGEAFSMEEKDPGSVGFLGEQFPATPQTKGKIEEFYEQYQNTDAIKQKVRSELGELSGVSRKLADLMLSEKTEEAFFERDKKAREVSVFLSERMREREFTKASEVSQQELEEQILQITTLTQSLKEEYSKKVTEIFKLTESIQQYQNQMVDLESKSLESQSESEQIVNFYQERLSILKSSLAEAQQQLLNANVDKATLKHESKLLRLQHNHNSELLKAYSPLKKVVDKSSSSIISSIPVINHEDTKDTIHQNNQGIGNDNDRDSDSDSDVDLSGS